MLLDAVNKENQVMGRTYKEAWLAEGAAKGIATSLLQVLEHRQWTVSTELERRVLDTRDEPTLRRWFQRALAADSLDRVFEPAVGLRQSLARCSAGRHPAEHDSEL